MAEGTYTPIAVSFKAVQQWGCPYCGYRSGHSPISGGGTVVFVCGECRRSFAILGTGVLKSTIGFGSFYPKLQPHPRSGIPSHGALDKRPDGGGEFFRSRGIGLDMTPGCFVCGGGERMYSNIAAFVQCKESGERVVAMFRQGARLDYREHEPDYVQVKVGACKEHLHCLQNLDELVSNGVITEEMILTAC